MPLRLRRKWELLSSAIRHCNILPTVQGIRYVFVQRMFTFSRSAMVAVDSIPSGACDVTADFIRPWVTTTTWDNLGWLTKVGNLIPVPGTRYYLIHTPERDTGKQVCDAAEHKLLYSPYIFLLLYLVLRLYIYMVYKYTWPNTGRQISSVPASSTA